MFNGLERFLIEKIRVNNVFDFIHYLTIEGFGLKSILNVYLVDVSYRYEYR